MAEQRDDTKPLLDVTVFFPCCSPSSLQHLPSHHFRVRCNMICWIRLFLTLKYIFCLLYTVYNNMVMWICIIYNKVFVLGRCKLLFCLYPFVCLLIKNTTKTYEVCQVMTLASPWLWSLTSAWWSQTQLCVCCELISPGRAPPCLADMVGTLLPGLLKVTEPSSSAECEGQASISW